MNAPTITRERPNACCNIVANLAVEQSAANLFVEHCTVCGRNHYVAVVDAGDLRGTVRGLHGSSMAALRTRMLNVLGRRTPLAE